jgi:hypothetical protein
VANPPTRLNGRTNLCADTSGLALTKTFAKYFEFDIPDKCFELK